MWLCIMTFMWLCIVTCDCASWRSCDCASWHVTVHRDVHVTVHRDMWLCIVTCDRASWQILIIKPTRCTDFSNLFWNETPHVLDNSSVHHQELFTVYTAMVYVIQVCRQLSSSSRIRMELPSAVPSWSCCCCSKAVYKPVWHIPLLCVQWKTPDDGLRNCPKHVKFHSKINLRN
jgi:hypothetical protein